MEKRSTKRLIIVFIYLILFIAVVFIIYRALKPKETCFDKIKNQNEEDVDCGGVCIPCKKIEAQDLVVENKGLVESGRPEGYDFWVLISNPNRSFGAESFQYKIKLKDNSGGLISEKIGTEFILPGEKKYIVENGLSLENYPVQVEFSIEKVDWKEFDDYYEKPNLSIVNKSYNQISSGVGFAEALGLLKNESPYDFNVIKIQIILKDSSGKIIALNSTEMRTVKSGEERDFRALWPNHFSEEVARVEAQAEVNIFESEAFIKNIKSL
jgi:hypothetical protein